MAADEFFTCPFVVFERSDFDFHAGQVGKIVEKFHHFFCIGELGLPVYVVIYEVFFHLVFCFPKASLPSMFILYSMRSRYAPK